jgi:hypothetical protein
MIMVRSPSERERVRSRHVNCVRTPEQMIVRKETLQDDPSSNVPELPDSEETVESTTRKAGAFVVLICALPVLCQTQAPPRSGQMKQRGLFGPVHSIESTRTIQVRDEAPRTMSRNRATFSPEGLPISEESWDANGKLMSRMTRTFDAMGHPVEFEVFTPQAKAPDPVRTVMTTSTDGVRETLKYDGNGNLLDRSEARSSPQGMREQHYDATGAPTEQLERHMMRTADPDGAVHIRSYENGRAISDATTKRTLDGSSSSSVSDIAGGQHKLTMERDKSGIRSVQTSGNQTTATATDTNGHVQVQIQMHDGTETKMVHHYDDAGREIELSLYTDGKLDHKQSSTYTTDEHGNWLRKVTEAVDADGKRISTAIEERTITYY